MILTRAVKDACFPERYRKVIHVAKIQRVPGIVLRDEDGPSTIEPVDILNTNEWDEQYGVLEDGICVSRFPPYNRYWTPEPEKRYQPFLIDPRTVD